MLKAFLVLAGITLLVNACSTTRSITQLDGAEWNVASLFDKTLKVNDMKKSLPSLIFGDNGKLFGSTGCNNFTGSYKRSGTKLSLSPGAMTKIFCPGNTEQDFLKAINQVTNFRIDDNKLKLLNGTTIVMSLVPTSK